MLNEYLEISRLPQIAAPTRKVYPSDLSDVEWEVLRPLLIELKAVEYAIEDDLREVLNAILYVHRTGCQWEMLPHDLPPYTTVYGYFQKWRGQGKWQDIYARLPLKKSQSQVKSIVITSGL